MRNWRQFGFSVCLVVAACRGREVVRGGAARFPGDTAGIIRPQALDDVPSVVRQLNAIVEARVRDASTDFDPCEGPRTILHLGEVRTLLGAAHTDTMQLRLFGGPVGSDRYIEFSESPRYRVGGRYVLFLFNTDWRFSPVISSHAFRIDSAAGREILIAPNGQAVTGVSQLAVETRTRILAVPDGVPGIGTVSMSPTAVTSVTPCGMNPDGTPNCPRVPSDSTISPEFFPAQQAWIPRPATREDIVNTLDKRQLVKKIDSVARSIGVTPGGYYAGRSRLECWDAIPTRGPAQ